MTQSTHILPALATVALSMASTANAEQVFSENIIVDGDLCAGSSCAAGETFAAQSRLKLSATGVGIQFNDTGGTSDNDWRLLANDIGEDSFYLVDDTGGTTPFKIMGTAPDNSLLVAADGKIGLGTMLPTANLHLKNSPHSEIRFEAANSSDFNYLLQASEFGFAFFTQSPGIVQQDTPRIIIRNDAPPFAFTVDTNEVRIGESDSTYDFLINGAIGSQLGAISVPLFFADASENRVGIGTKTPDAPFELSGPGTFNFFRITAEDATINRSVDITFTQGPLGTGQLRYNIVDGDNQEMSLDADGNMVLDGTLTTAGPTCAAGCDRVFDPEYTIARIEDRAAQMYSAGHLPAIGPTQPGTPVNVTEKLAGVINELEHAHIYIAQLKTEHVTAQATLSGEIAMLSARLEALELR